MIDEGNSKIYTFTFNDRIKKNHDIKIAVDGKRIFKIYDLR